MTYLSFIFDWRGEASLSHWWWDKVALAKSVNKLLLAASASKACFIVVTWYFMFAFGLTYVSLEWPRERPLFELDLNEHQWAKTGPLFKSPSRPLLKSGMQPLDRYGTCQETISRRREQMYSPSDTGLEKAWRGAIIQVSLK